MKVGIISMNVKILSLLLVGLVSLPLSYALAQEDSSWINIPIGKSALWIEIDGDKAYVTNPEDGKISIIDINSKMVVDSIDTPKGVLIVEAVPEKNKLYATVDDQNKVFVFDIMTHEKLKEIDIGEPEIVLFSKSDKPYGQREYTSFATSGVGLAYNPNNEMLYVVHSEVNHINVIDTTTDEVVDTIAVGKTPLLMKIDVEGNVGYVSNWESNEITVIDLATNTVTKNLQTGFVPAQMVIDHENMKLYVTHNASPHVTVINLNDSSILEKIQLKAPTHAIALDKTAGILHVTYMPTSGITGQSFIDRVEFIDTKTNKLIGGNQIPSNPFVFRITDNQQLFGSVIKDGVVFAIDLTQRPIYQENIEKSTSMEQKEPTGGGCLIATAAYGTELAPQVQLLREIRDNTVMSTSSGAAFMTGFNQIYYSFSPTIADMERENPMFQEAVRAFITPMISTLSIMTLAEDGSDAQVLGLGISVIMLNLGIYIAAPAVTVWQIKKRI